MKDRPAVSGLRRGAGGLLGLAVFALVSCAGTDLQAPPEAASPERHRPEHQAAERQAAEVGPAAFLAGTWREERPGQAGVAVVEESWSEPLRGGSLGHFRWIAADGRVVVHELLSIQEQADGLFLRLRHFDGRMHAREDVDRPLVLRASRVETGRIVFRAHADCGDLDSIHYELSPNETNAPDRLAIVVHFREASGRRPITFAMQRQ